MIELPDNLTERLKGMSPQKRIKLLEQVKLYLRSTGDLQGAFKEQTQFLQDKSLFKVVLCTRRAGKSYAIGLDLYIAALRNPGSTSIYLALTRDSAKNIMWKDVIMVIDRSLGLNSQFNVSDLTVTLQNGSVIRLMGADATDKERDKLLGAKYAYVAIDEAQSFTQDLNLLINDILLPALADLSGTVCLIGTPTYMATGLFYELTRGQDPIVPGRWQVRNWSGHRWSWRQNVVARKAIRAQLKELKVADPSYFETSEYRRNYLGLWTGQDIPRVYAGFSLDRNTYDELPPDDPRNPWIHLMSVDLGYNDPSAIIVGCWRRNHRVLYIREAWERSQITLDVLAQKISELKSKYGCVRIVVDGANKQAIQTMTRMYHINFEIAHKADKASSIAQLNTELESSRIKVHRYHCTWPTDDRKKGEPESLQQELLELVYDRHGHEHPGMSNHATDTLLYMLHASGHMTQRPDARANLSDSDKLFEQMTGRKVSKMKPVLVQQDRDLNWDSVWESY